MMSAFEKTYGFRRDEIRLSNWRTRPFSRFSFQHAREMVPTAVISCGGEKAEGPAVDDGPLAGFRFDDDGKETRFRDFLEQTFTDTFVAMKSGDIIAEWSAPHADPSAQHILFSVTKSVTGLVAGMLEDDGLLDPRAPVSQFLPEARNGAYGDATVQDLLDMRISLDFDESYLNTDGDYDRYRRAMLWNPQRSDKPAETLAAVLMSLPKGGGPHGGPFFYASPNTDVLSLVIERASGQRYAELVSQRIWAPAGARTDAYVTLDAVGAPRGAGGICATARDLARLGEMVRVGGNGIVSQRWVEDMRTAGDREAWANGSFSALFPQGRYRSCWYQTGYESEAFCGIGIHGQWLYVDPSRGVTIVKLSSEPTPSDDMLDRRSLAFFRAVSAAL